MFCMTCERFGDDKTSSFVTGCITFRVELINSHEISVFHVSANKKATFQVMKEKKKIVACSYTGKIDSTSSSCQSAPETSVPGCSNVVGDLDFSIRKLNENQLKQEGQDGPKSIT